jgi:alpha-tubulin suppressor-like RCC1 family protein
MLLLAALLLAGSCALSLSCSDSEEPPEGTHPESTTLPADITPPPNATALQRVSAISAGAYHTCTLTDGGSAVCWGGNETGQLGDGTTADRAFAAPISGLGGEVTQVVTGFSSTCAITTGGALLCWGRNDTGAIGDGTSEAMHTTPTQVLGLGADVREVAVGREHACAVTTGKVWCWGDNTFGQLGAETAEQQQSTPVEVVGLSSDVVSIGLGWYHTCVLTASGQVMCWGNNQTAQLGTGSGPVSQSNSPIAIEGLPSGITSLAVGGGHNCVLTEAGAVVCWGANNYGQTAT